MYDVRIQYETHEERMELIHDANSKGWSMLMDEVTLSDGNFLTFRAKTEQEIEQEQKVAQLEAENHLLQQRIAQAQDDVLFILENLFS